MVDAAPRACVGEPRAIAICECALCVVRCARLVFFFRFDKDWSSELAALFGQIGVCGRKAARAPVPLVHFDTI